MRVTDLLSFEMARSATAQAREAAETAQQAVSSGSRINQPGDDPAGAGLLIAYQMSASRLTAISSATSAASDELNSADAALGNVSTALSQARELAVQLSNATYSASDRSNGAQEVSGIVSTVVAALNTRVGDRYIFAGTADAQAPFEPDGTYAGNGATRSVEIAPGVWQAANVRADVAMGASGTGGTDVLGTLQSLEQALAANDSTTVQNLLGALGSSIDQVAAARSEAGTMMQTLDTATTAAKTASTAQTTLATQLDQVDLADAAVQMQATQTALQASLSAAAQSFHVSLLDYLTTN